MYCGKCGKNNPKDSIFCQSCGLKIVETLAGNKNDKKAKTEVSSSEIKNKEILPSDKKISAGLTGWLALIGLGLIVNPIINSLSLSEYFSLFNQTYDIPGYMMLLRFEFVAIAITIIAAIYLLFLYFKKNIKFPKHYITFQIFVAAYAALDYLFLASLTASTQEQQKIITDTLSQYSGKVGQSIFFAIIWILYMKKSKKVKATFINK